MSFNIEKTDKKRVVIIGGGFGGLRLALDLVDSDYQVVLVDKNNYNQFQPLIYQVATSGLYPSSISFPFRKLFDKSKNIYFRMAELRGVYADKNMIQTSIGKIEYDYLVLAFGSRTNYFNNANIEHAAMPMKFVDESMGLRNALLSNFERSTTTSSQDEKESLLNVVIVGGGPSGVEVAGAIAEMKHYVLPKDYPDLDANMMNIFLVQASDRLLPAMSEKASKKSLKYLEKMGVNVMLNTHVNDYKDNKVILGNGQTINSKTFIWVCGVKVPTFSGIRPEQIGPGNRLLVDQYNKLLGSDNIFAIGDCALMQSDANFPKGHPQMAQPSIQQGALLAKNLKALLKDKPLKAFTYKDLGSMATVGKNKAVADIFGLKLTGPIAWMLWMLVHLRSILGVKNKLSVLMDWTWSYFTYDKSNRMILTAFTPQIMREREELERKSHWGDLDPNKNR